MPLNIQPLRAADLEDLYRMMVQQKFPDVPDSFEEAEEYLEDIIGYGAFEKGRLKAGFIFGDVTEESAFFDAVCAPNYHGKWATPKTMRKLYGIAFKQLALDFLWAQPRNSKSLTAALKSGFVYATDTSRKDPVLILTRRNVPPKFLNKEIN